MKKYFENLAKALLGQPYNELSKNEQEVIKSIAEGEPLAENVNISFHEQSVELHPKLTQIGVNP